MNKIHAIELDEHRAKRQKRSVELLSREQKAYLKPVPISALDNGHMMMDSLRARLTSLDTNKLYRSYNQVLIHVMLMSACVEQVYGPDSCKYEAEIKRYNDFMTMRSECAITMPRRQGKTRAVAMFVAAAMMEIPGFDAICFAASEVSAGKESGMLGLVYKILKNDFGVTKFIKNNKNTISIIINGTERTFKAYPSGTDALRGVGGRFVIVEEAGYVKEKQFTDLIIPLLTVRGVCLVVLSTLNEDEAAWFNELIHADTIAVFSVKYVCEDCEEKGVTDPCPHKNVFVPHWTSSERQALTKALYGKKNKERYAIEVIGVVKPGLEGRIFSPIKIREIFSKPPMQLLFPVKYIYVTIDPCVGTDDAIHTKSDFCVVAVAEPESTIMGMFGLPAIDTEEYRPTLLKFLTDLRSHELTLGAVLVVDVEHGTGMMAGDIYTLVQERFKNVLVVNDLRRKRGTTTDEKMKHDCMQLSRYTLHKDRVHFWDNFVTGMDLDPDQVKAEFKQQMGNYKQEFVKGSNVMAKNSYKLTGKGKNGDNKDDYCFTWQRAVRLHDRFESDVALRTRLVL